MKRHTKLLLTVLIPLILLSTVFYMLYSDYREGERLKNHGIPYKDERTITVSINEKDKYKIGERKYNRAEFIEKLNELSEDFGNDFPIVLRFSQQMMNQDLNPYLEAITDTHAYRLHFAYRGEILRVYLPCPCVREKDEFFIYIPIRRKEADIEYRVITQLKEKDIITSEVDSLSRDELIDKLKDRPNSLRALAMNQEFTEIEPFLELLYICRKAGCGILEIGILEPEFEARLKEAKGKVTISLTEEK